MTGQVEQSQAIAATVHASTRCGPVCVLEEVDSTSSWLLNNRDQANWHRSICVANVQTSGRGRRGDVWDARPNDDVVLSVGWRTERGLMALGGLSLAAGVAAVEALASFGIGGVGVKWPNDLVADRRKLAGILIETMTSTSSTTDVVIGIGMNRSALGPSRAGSASDRIAVGDLLSPCPSRNEIAGALGAELFLALENFETSGLGPFRERFARCDALMDQPVRARAENAAIEGWGAGINEDGELNIRCDNGDIVAVNAGAVTLRSQEAGA